MTLYTPACLVMFPRPRTPVAAVIAFGPWLGFLYSLSGIVASSIVTYYVGRRMRRDTVRRLAGPKLDRMIQVLKKHGLLAMTLLRLVPLAPFAVESIVAGAIHMRLWHVAVGTAIGLLPGTLATTIFGEAIETALTGAGAVNWWLVGGAVGLLAGGIVAGKRGVPEVGRRIHSAENAPAPAAGKPAPPGAGQRRGGAAQGAGRGSRWMRHEAARDRDAPRTLGARTPLEGAQAPGAGARDQGGARGPRRQQRMVPLQPAAALVQPPARPLR